MNAPQFENAGRCDPPARLGPLPQHAGIRARDIDEDRIERTIRQVRAILTDELRRDPARSQTLAILFDESQSFGTDVSRDDLTRVLHQLGEMTRLAAGCRTDIPHALTRLRRESFGRTTGRQVLHRKPTFRIARQPIDRTGFLQHNGTSLTDGLRSNARCHQRVE